MQFVWDQKKPILLYFLDAKKKFRLGGVGFSEGDTEENGVWLLVHDMGRADLLRARSRGLYGGLEV